MIALIFLFSLCSGTSAQTSFFNLTTPNYSSGIPTTMTPSYIITNVTAFLLTLPTASTTSTIRQTTLITTTTTSRTSSTTTLTTRTTASALNRTVTFNPDTCSNSNYVRLMNGTCVTKLDAQTFCASILRNQGRNSSNAGYALSLYINSITNATTLSNSSNTLSAGEIDTIVSELDGFDLTINSNTSFLTVQKPIRDDDNTILLGASFERGIGGQTVDTSNKDNITTSSISAAGIVDRNSLDGVTSLRMFIIDLPTGYENVDNTSSTKTLASSVIVADLKRNRSSYNPVNISLYFRPLSEYKRNGSGEYLCSFYDMNNSRWNESGCTRPRFSSLYRRYECSCNHLTSFALIWLPEYLSTSNSTKSFDAQDIVSLVAQLISIFCFLLVLIHATRVRMSNSLERLHTLKLLPLLSTAATTVLFIFFIALGLTVYTQTSSNDETECFRSSKVLMFITYFLLILMFSIKTSVGYFYYLRFVRLFPQPSHRKLLTMVLISFLLALVSVALAIGLDTNSSFHIVQLYPYQFCWFTRDVIYYFLTIPIGVFLFLNIITIMLIARSIITHALHGKTSEQRIERFKRCAIILLSSAVTQGIGWLLGPFISFIQPTAAMVLGWIFILVNALEGLWSIIIYALIRQRQLDEQKRITTVMKLRNTTGSSNKKDKKAELSFKDLRRRDGNLVET